MTTTDSTPINALVVDCPLCRQTSTLQRSALKLYLYTHGVMVLRYFCLHCHELCSNVIHSVEFARSLAARGVASEVIRVPEEMAEHPGPEVKAITEMECRYLEVMALTFFNERFRRELCP